MNLKKLLLAASFALSSQAIAADLDANDIAESLGQALRIDVGTQFIVNGQPYSVTRFAFEKQGYTGSAYERQMLAEITAKEFLGNSGHFRFNTTVDKSPIYEALSAGFRRVPEAARSADADLELFVRSQFPECGATLLLAATKIDPSQFTQFAVAEAAAKQ